MTTGGSFAALDRMLMRSSDRAVSQQPSSSRPQCRFEMCVPVNLQTHNVVLLIHYKHVLVTCHNRDKQYKTYILFLKTKILKNIPSI